MAKRAKSTLGRKLQDGRTDFTTFDTHSFLHVSSRLYSGATKTINASSAKYLVVAAAAVMPPITFFGLSKNEYDGIKDAAIMAGRSVQGWVPFKHVYSNRDSRGYISFGRSRRTRPSLPNYGAEYEDATGGAS